LLKNKVEDVKNLIIREKAIFEKTKKSVMDNAKKRCEELEKPYKEREASWLKNIEDLKVEIKLAEEDKELIKKDKQAEIKKLQNELKKTTKKEDKVTKNVKNIKNKL